MTMCTITHAYLAVGIAGVAAFVLLLLCGQHHSLAVAELGGTEVSMPASAHKAITAGHDLPRTAPKAAAQHVAAGLTDSGIGCQ